MRKKFEFLPHTADFKIRVYGKNLNSLINNALSALEAFWQPKLTKKKRKIKINLEDKDLPSLIINFLSEILSQTYIKKTIFLKFEGRILEERKIRGNVWGYEFKNLKKDIKAITYHQANLWIDNGFYTFEFIIDI